MIAKLPPITEPGRRLLFSVTVETDGHARGMSETDWQRIAKRLERAATGRSKTRTVTIDGIARYLS